MIITSDKPMDVLELKGSRVQCAAVRTHSSEIKVPPHHGVLDPGVIKPTCHGNSPTLAFLPPMILAILKGSSRSDGVQTQSSAITLTNIRTT